MTAADRPAECFCRETYPQLRSGEVTHGPGCPRRPDYKAHADCWFGEPCAIGKPTECPPCIADARRDRGTPWSELELRREYGDLRHYLDGRDVHCGDVLELQAHELRSDDYGEYTRRLPEGKPVRYEATRGREGGLVVRLFTRVAGHEFTAPLDTWHRFRWPVR